MRILNVSNEVVEVMWVDDNEIELIPMDEFISKYGQAKIDAFRIKRGEAQPHSYIQS